VKEVLDRLRVTGSGRAVWPVLEVEGRILWMKGVEVQQEAGLLVTADDEAEKNLSGQESGLGGRETLESRD